MPHQDSFPLNDGSSIPSIGVGLYKVTDDEVREITAAAIEVGWRLFDTATMYGNEAALGDALREVNRDEVFVTSKILNTDQGRQSTKDALHRSLELMQLDYLDLYLIHWPAPRQDKYVETWESMIELQQEGLIRSIGVSNFHTHHLDRIIAATNVVPSVNQVECHPWLPQRDRIRDDRALGILTQAWSPFARGRVLTDETLNAIAAQHEVSAAVVALAWQRQRGVASVFKTSNPERLKANTAARELRLDDTEITALDNLGTELRTGADPDDRD